MLPTDYDTIKKIIESNRTKLPGLQAHKLMAPPARINPDYHPEPRNAGKSAVLILIYEDAGELYIPFIERSKDGSVHSGQIALPGGKKEADDRDHIDTAIRETEEEIGVDVPRSDVLANLSPLYIPVSNFTVRPVVAFRENRPQFKLNPTEVAALHIVNLRELLSCSVITKTLRIANHPMTIPFYKINSTEIWGATAMIISELRELMTRV